MQVGDAYLIVYSITDRASFEKASELRIQLRRARQTEDIPIILVGNKSDLVRCREVSISGKRTGANTRDSLWIFFQTGILPSLVHAVGAWDSFKCFMEFYVSPDNHPHAGCCSLVHPIYLQDSNLLTPRGFPGVPLGKISYSRVYGQSQTFFAGPFCVPGRSQRVQRSRGSIFMQEGWGL